MGPGHCVQTLALGPQHPVYALAWRDKGCLTACGALPHAVDWDVENGAVRRNTRDAIASRIAFSSLRKTVSG